MNMILAANDVAVIPNFINILSYHFKNSPWLNFLQHWETIVFSIMISLCLSLFFYLGTRKMSLIPSGLQNFLEWLLEKFAYFFLAILGEGGKKYIPFLGTLFIYILAMNLFGLVPLMKSPSSSLNVTFALAICVFLLVQYANIKNMGLKTFLYHMAGSPKDILGWVIAPLMFPIELMTQLSRPVTLSLRLFGNILGEKVLVGFFTLMSVTLLFFFPIQLPFVLLGVFTGMVQAIVFTLLSAIYIFLSVPHKETH